MILSFKPQFKEKILNGSKIHTIRGVTNRWFPGRKIHFATGVRTKNYNCFKEGECIGLQKIYISSFLEYIEIDGRTLTVNQEMQLASNDGFDSLHDFYKWFDKDFQGVIIHWTDKKY